MNFFTNKKITNKIIIVLVALIIFNFVCPIHQVEAADVFGDVAGMIISPVRNLFLSVFQRNIYSYTRICYRAMG